MFFQLGKVKKRVTVMVYSYMSFKEWLTPHGVVLYSMVATQSR